MPQKFRDELFSPEFFCLTGTVDIGGNSRNVLWDSLGEAGERPALPRNCKLGAAIKVAALVESGDRANRWSRKNLRGRGRLQESFSDYCRCGYAA
jgi:hypothetical protein